MLNINPHYILSTVRCSSRQSLEHRISHVPSSYNMFHAVDWGNVDWGTIGKHNFNRHILKSFFFIFKLLVFIQNVEGAITFSTIRLRTSNYFRICASSKKIAVDVVVRKKKKINLFILFNQHSKHYSIFKHKLKTILNDCNKKIPNPNAFEFWLGSTGVTMF